MLKSLASNTTAHKYSGTNKNPALKFVLKLKEVLSTQYTEWPISDYYIQYYCILIIFDFFITLMLQLAKVELILMT